MKTPKDVDSYIEAAPKEIRATLTELRRVIKSVAPGASELISYGMPFYEYGGTGYKGRLVYFAVFKKHISLFIIPWYAETVPAELYQHTTRARRHTDFLWTSRSRSRSSGKPSRRSCESVIRQTRQDDKLQGNSFMLPPNMHCIGAASSAMPLVTDYAAR